MKTISSSIIYKGLYKDLETRFGHDEAHRIWALAEGGDMCDFRYSLKNRT